MDSKRLLVGTLVGAVVITGGGFLIFEVILGSYFEPRMIVVPREAPIVWAALLSGLSQGLLLTLVLGWAGDTSVVGGLKTAALVGFLIWFGADMILYGLFEYAMLSGALGDAVGAILQYGLAGAAIGAVSRQKAQPAAA